MGIRLSFSVLPISLKEKDQRNKQERCGKKERLKEIAYVPHCEKAIVGVGVFAFEIEQEEFLESEITERIVIQDRYQDSQNYQRYNCHDVFTGFAQFGVTKGGVECDRN